MTDDQARVLERGGNIAVTWLDGRAFPGLHVQGDTFSTLHHRLADATGRLRDVADAEALDTLRDVVDEMAGMLRFYESALAQQGMRLPYRRADPG
ncbi:DUF6959 family protein [Dactylosporangium sp. CS-047395]|uniref:DUF6959 family protein n=1 Tax=Dactylosporangium sp. CS-047395 TaxID=3239936 RepID=UPI003D905533